MGVESSEEDIGKDQIMESLPVRARRRSSVTRLAPVEVRRLSGYNHVGTIRQILMDEANYIKMEEPRGTQAPRASPLNRSRGNLGSRKGELDGPRRAESISMYVNESPSSSNPTTPVRSRGSHRGSRGPRDSIRIMRSEEAATRLYNYVKDSDFFKQLPSTAAIEICRHIHYEDWTKGGVLFKEGDIGTSMFFILAGSVRVYKHLEDKSPKKQDAEKQEEKPSPFADGEEGEKPGDKKKPKGEGENFGRLLTTLQAPTTFGEIALLREGPRTATVVCNPGAEVMALHGLDFDRILRKLGNVVFMPERLKEILSKKPSERLEEDHGMVLDLLGRHKFLQNLQPAVAQQLVGKLTLSLVKKNELIFQQGEIGSQFYIILTGKVHIFVNRDVRTPDRASKSRGSPDGKEGGGSKGGSKDTSPRSRESMRHKRDKRSPDRDKGDGKGEMKIGFEHKPMVSEVVFSGRGDRIVMPSEWDKVLGTKMKTLNVGDSFGDRALLQKNALRTGSAIAADDTEMMVLSQEDFRKIFASQTQEVEGFERVAELLQGDRSEEQLNELAELLSKTSSFFQTLEPALHYDICKAASYLHLAPSDVVFEQGAIGDAFYVVLRGTLSLHIKGTPGQPPPKPEPKDPAENGGAEGEEQRDHEHDLTEIYGPCISVLSGGQSFGELALLHGMPRTGTVLCQEESELLALWKADYDEILQTSQARELERQVSFLRNLPHLGKLSTGRLMRIAYCFQLKTLTRGYTLLQQGKHVEKGNTFIYIVKEGAIKLVRRTNPKKLAGAFHASVAPSARLSILSNNLGLSPRSASKSLGNEDLYGLPQETEICVLGPGEICGDVAAFLDVPQPVSITAVCDTTLHVVKLEDFMRSISDEMILERFRDTSRSRLKWILEREKEITNTWTSFLRSAQELRMANLYPKQNTPKKIAKGPLIKTPASEKKKGGTSAVASSGMTKSCLVFQSRSVQERAEAAIRSLFHGNKKMDKKMLETFKGMDMSLTKQYWSPTKSKEDLSLPDLDSASATPRKLKGEMSPLAQVLSSKSSLYLSP